MEKEMNQTSQTSLMCETKDSFIPIAEAIEVEKIDLTDVYKIRELNLKAYFDKNKTNLCYDITYKLHEYKLNKFYLHIDIDEEGYYPSYKEYYFDSISSIENNINGHFKVEFNTGCVYKFDRFSKKDVELLHKFLVKNIMFKKYD
jgi:hypothetical protein